MVLAGLVVSLRRDYRGMLFCKISAKCQQALKVNAKSVM